MFNFSFFNCYQAPGPHREAQSFVYNHTTDVEGNQVPMYVGAVPAPDLVNLCWDDTPMGNSFPPAPVTAAAAAAEAYGGVGAVSRFPAGAHQTDKGVVYYTPAGVIRQEAAWPKNANMQQLPMGVCVYEFDPNLDDVPPEVEHEEAERLYHLKVKGIVQVRVDAAQANIAIGDFLEMQNGSFDLVVDAVNGNIGTFMALEACTTDDTYIWCWIVGVDY